MNHRAALGGALAAALSWMVAVEVVGAAPGDVPQGPAAGAPGAAPGTRVAQEGPTPRKGKRKARKAEGQEGGASEAPLTLAPPGEVTRCDLCHDESSWSGAEYAEHELTRYPLRGRHQQVPCAGCHTGGFDAPIHDTSCFACHADAHGGRFGTRCESCHDEESWRGRFDVDAHRKTNFPLQGAHAMIPCQDCHGVADGSRITSVLVNCVNCHEGDYQRTRFLSIDHAAAGFGTDCETCHFTWTFRAARFPEHDACFQINGGPHRQVACHQCHLSLRGLTVNGTCTTNNAACTSCHRHDEATSAADHQNVLGYQWRDRMCYECHRFAP